MSSVAPSIKKKLGITKNRVKSINKGGRGHNNCGKVGQLCWHIGSWNMRYSIKINRNSVYICRKKAKKGRFLTKKQKILQEFCKIKKMTECKDCPYYIANNKGYPYCCLYCADIDFVIIHNMCKFAKKEEK